MNEQTAPDFLCMVYDLLFIGPVFPVQVPVTDGFCQMSGLYVRRVVQIGYGTGYFQNPVVGACRQI